MWCREGTVTLRVIRNFKNMYILPINPRRVLCPHSTTYHAQDIKLSTLQNFARIMGKELKVELI